MVALSGAVYAQSPAVLGQDDAVFARKLYESGYPDLAEQLCETIEKHGKASPAEMVGVKALHLDLQLDLARREPDLYKRKDMIKSALEEKEDLVQQYGGSKEAEDTANTLPDGYAKLGETLALLVQKETDVGLVGQLQAEGQQIYAKAEEELEKRLLALDELRSSDPKIENQYMVGKFNLPRMYYFHSLLYPKGEWKKGELLEKAIAGFDLFSLDYDDQYLNFEGRIFRGLCDRDSDKYEEALTSFDEAIGLREEFPLDEKAGYFQMPELACDIVSDGTLQKVLLQTEHKDFEGAIATANDFLAKTPEPLNARRGLAVVAAKAEAELALGDVKAAGDTAQQLVDADDRGPWGAKGREIQAKLIGGGGGGGAIDAASTLKIASTLASRGNSEAAMKICRQAVANAKGSAQEAEVVTEAHMLLGSMFLERGWYYEAALAFDEAGEKYPNAEKAPEVVYLALQTYSRLNSLEKGPYFKKRVDERMKTLATKYPNHPRAASAQLVEGQDLESDQKFIEAADLYAKVQPGTASYQEAQFRLGNAYFLQANKLLREGKPADAKQYVGQAETILKKSVTDLEAEAGKTIDLAARQRLDNLAFAARRSVVQMFLQRGVDRPADALAMLDGVDEKYAADGDKISAAWGFRIDALQAQGKLDEAVQLLESLAKKSPNSPAIGPAAGKVARALDARSIELRDKEKKPKDADALQRKAAQYYSISGKALLAGNVTRAGEVEAIADRLYVLGLIFNKVPEGAGTSFVGWSPESVEDAKLWQEAAALYEAALRVSPSYTTEIDLARIYGFLGDYANTARVLGGLFDREVVWDSAGRRFNNALLKSKPELLAAYLEWGIAEHEAARKDQDTEGFARAFSILDSLVSRGGLEANSRLWWHAKYHQIGALHDQGRYEQAAILLRETERQTQELGGGDPALKNDFKALQAELAKKTLDGAQGSPRDAGAAPPAEKPR